MAMVDATVSRRLSWRPEAKTEPNTELLEIWKPLINKIRKKAAKRNEIAHCKVMSFNDKNNKYKGTYALPYWAMSKLPLKKIKPNSDTFFELEGEPSPLDEVKLTERLNSFSRLERDLYNFYDQLREHVGR